ncbi:MAG: class I SAM-dependent methyltransferase [Bacteroidota bacterium]
MNPNKALWEKGDFTRIAETMRESGAALVAKLNIAEGLKVLDLGCGDGTTAIPAAQLGAKVLGVDIARNLVAAGNARIAELGLTNCSIQEGDAMLWGVESAVTERFVQAGIPAEKITFERDTFTFNTNDTPVALVNRFRQFYGPTMNAFEAAEKNGKARLLQEELGALFVSQNKSGNAQTTSIPATYMRVTVVR